MAFEDYLENSYQKFSSAENRKSIGARTSIILAFISNYLFTKDMPDSYRRDPELLVNCFILFNIIYWYSWGMLESFLYGESGFHESIKKIECRKCLKTVRQILNSFIEENGRFVGRDEYDEPLSKYVKFMKNNILFIDAHIKNCKMEDCLCEEKHNCKDGRYFGANHAFSLLIKNIAESKLPIININSAYFDSNFMLEKSLKYPDQELSSFIKRAKKRYPEFQGNFPKFFICSDIKKWIDDSAYAFYIPDYDVILINSNGFDRCDDDYKLFIILHELAHALQNRVQKTALKIDFSLFHFLCHDKCCENNADLMAFKKINCKTCIQEINEKYGKGRSTIADKGYFSEQEIADIAESLDGHYCFEHKYQVA